MHDDDLRLALACELRTYGIQQGAATRVEDIDVNALVADLARTVEDHCPRCSRVSTIHLGERQRDERRDEIVAAAMIAGPIAALCTRADGRGNEICGKAAISTEAVDLAKRIIALVSENS